jgi:hypothetical protein
MHKISVESCVNMIGNHKKSVIHLAKDRGITITDVYYTYNKPGNVTYVFETKEDALAWRLWL